ncbi:glucuronate isomerase [Hyphomonas johnsonii]|uniref:Uronate isomerase n=1 Tax=Hyphomonas johnsonii MHS-2 TaxID=1280950 RepID=A0A059FRY7_9PROT|nr:glucuronate isomerase [Hyphomonas johnsonii]KCZ93377.1 glucuronate isomerase [Hyphomonas johnsonii MHS-2]
MTKRPLNLDPDRFFPPEDRVRTIARELYATVSDLPIISPHGHTDPAWFASNAPFSDAASLLVVPDHYVLRMLYSQGVRLEDLCVPRRDGTTSTDTRAAWRLFAKHFHLFRGTPTRAWFDHVFSEVFGFDYQLDAGTADAYYDTITEALATPAYRPRAILDRFKVEFLATTEGALDPLDHHGTLNADGWGDRIVTTFRPDDVLDPARVGLAERLDRLAVLTGERTDTWEGYLRALRVRRAFFKVMGAKATDHGHPTARTANLSVTECRALFDRVRLPSPSPEDCELFRAQMLTEMAGMSLDDGLVMQLHPGSFRNHNPALFAQFGTDKGADIPVATNYVDALKPLLDKHGNNADLTLIVFTLDETTYARELAPLTGHYPCLRLGPPWWFHDSPEGMMRFRQQVTETAGFYNTAGFNDDTRALLSIPARHDLARRMDCRYLAGLVAEGRLDADEAFDLAFELTDRLVRDAYKLDSRPTGMD